MKNPLRIAFPGFDTTDKADPDHILAISCDAQRMAGELFQGCLPAKRIPHLIHNLDLLLAIPAVSEHLDKLKGVGLTQFYRRALALVLLFQGCLWKGQSESIRSFAPFLPYFLTGICLRHFEAPALPPEARRVLLSEREFDLDDPRELRQREHLFNQIRDVEENLIASRGFKRFIFIAKPTGKNQVANIAAAIIRYSGRLTGRTATHYSRDILWRIPAGVVYLELLDNVAAAWCRHQKPPVLVLAEEYSRLCTASRFMSVGELSSRSRDALNDLLDLFGIELLPNFQGLGHPAFYIPAQNLLVRAVVEFSEVASRGGAAVKYAVGGRPMMNRVSGRMSARWLARQAARGPRATSEEEKASQLAASEAARTTNFVRWRRFAVEGPFSLENRRKLETVDKGHMADPANESLKPLDPPAGSWPSA